MNMNAQMVLEKMEVVRWYTLHPHHQQQTELFMKYFALLGDASKGKRKG